MENLKGKKDRVQRRLCTLDFEVFYNISWIMAKTADPTIPEPMEWLEQFDEFPMVEIIPELQDLMLHPFKQQKKSRETMMKAN